MILIIIRIIVRKVNGSLEVYAAMVKSELILRIADANLQLPLKDVERIVCIIFEKITDALERGDRVELRGFGIFSTKQRDARVGRNPKTGEPVQIDAKTFPFFKVGKELHGLINDTQKTPEKECD